MKNLIVFIAIVAACGTGSAQEAGDVNFGIIAGANLTFPGGGDIYDLKQDAKENNESNPMKMRFGMHIGTRMEYFPSTHAGFGTGLIYNQKGWTEDYGGNFDDPGEEKYKIRLHYIEIPALLVINLKGFHIYGGPAVSILVLNRAKLEQTDFDGNRYVTEEEKGSVTDIADYDPPKSFTGGFCFGLKGQLPKGITVGAGLSFTAPVFPSASEDPVNINMSTLQISIGKVFIWKREKKEETQNAYSEELKNLKANYDQLSAQVASVSDDLAVVNQKVSPVGSMHLKIDELTTDVEDMTDEIKNLKIGSQTGNTNYSPSPDRNGGYDQHEDRTPEPEYSNQRLPVPCYVIVSGSFSTERAAQDKARELKQKGLDADYYHCPDYERGCKLNYRVYVGPYTTGTEADNMLGRVRAKVPGAWKLWVE